MDPGKEERGKDGEMNFSQGLLGHLEQVELRGRREAAERERQERSAERAEFLKRRLRELRMRRDRLRQELGNARQGKARTVADPDPREVLEWKIRDYQELLRIFQLTGLSGSVSKQGVTFSLHTAFEGSFLDVFHVEFQEFREFRQFRLGRHSVPPFIPMERLSREFLPGKPREFLRSLLDHLNAFVARRHQLEKFQEEFSEFILGVPSQNSLCNLLSFQYRIPGKTTAIPGKKPGKKNRKKAGIPEEFPEFQARLLYGDPLRSLPTDVTVTSAAGAAAPPEHSELFRSLPLPRAFRALQSLEPLKIWEFLPGNQ